MTEQKTKTLYTIREAAEFLGVSQALIYALCSERKIRHERHGLKRGRIRIPHDGLDEYRRRSTVEVAAPEELRERPRKATPAKPISSLNLQNLTLKPS